MREETRHIYTTIDKGMALVRAGLGCLAQENGTLETTAGRDYQGDDKAIAELRDLSPEAQGFLQHHINNVLCAVHGFLYCDQPERAQEAVCELIDIMKKINPRREALDAAVSGKTKDSAEVCGAAHAETVR